jgi:hypothetical protein
VSPIPDTAGAPRARLLAAALAAAAAVLAALAAPAPAAAAGRFAIIAGNNVGDATRPRLWFAEKDAERFLGTLTEIGDFAPEDVVLLRGRGPSELEAAVRALDPRIRAARDAGQRTLLVVYYSGHAGAAGLELGAEKLGYEALRAVVSASPADAKVAIVDACEAGLLTQVKGASVVPALAFAIPSDDLVSGTAFIASTAVGEQAQESAALGGSFFTHHLEIALRGAGDADGDGRVTLGEAFRYTSGRTAAGTAGTQVGPQHPTYEFKMSGRGDVVLSDLRRAQARLLVPPDPGALLVLKGPTGLLAEVPGAATEVTLALPAGPYVVERRSPKGRARGEVTLENGRTTALPLLEPTRYELARAKGGPKAGLTYVGAGVTHVGLPGFGVAPTGRIALRHEVGPIGVRVRVDYAAKSVTDDWLRYDFQYIGGAVAALYPLNVGRVLVEGGLEAGYGYATQRFPSGVQFSKPAGASGMVTGGAAILATAPLGPLRVGLDLTGGVAAFTLDEARTVKPTGSAALLVLYGF